MPIHAVYWAGIFVVDDLFEISTLIAALTSLASFFIGLMAASKKENRMTQLAELGEKILAITREAQLHATSAESAELGKKLREVEQAIAHELVRQPSEDSAPPNDEEDTSPASHDRPD